MNISAHKSKVNNFDNVFSLPPGSNHVYFFGGWKSDSSFMQEQQQSQTHFPEEGNVYLYMLFSLFSMKAKRWNDKRSEGRLRDCRLPELDFFIVTRSRLVFCFVNPSPARYLSFQLSSVIPPYIRASRAVSESEYRCLMDRWGEGLTWFSAVIQILAFKKIFSLENAQTTHILRLWLFHSGSWVTFYFAANSLQSTRWARVRAFISVTWSALGA